MNRATIERIAKRVSAIVSEADRKYASASSPDEERAVIRGLYAGLVDVIVGEAVQRAVEDILSRPEARRILEAASQ